MRKPTQTEITVEKHEIVVVRRGGKRIQHWCAACGGVVWMFTPEEAAAVSGLSFREIYRRIEAGAIHSFESEKGLLWVCMNAGLAPREVLEAGPEEKL